MASKIRWRDKDVKEVNRVIRNFNAKIKRAGDKDPNSIPFLPEPLTREGVTGQIKTRQDFNRILNSISRFSRRGAEELTSNEGGTVATKYEFREESIIRRVVATKRTAKRKELKLSKERGTEAQIREQNLNVPTERKTATLEELRRRITAFQKEASARFDVEGYENYKKNYIKALDTQLQGENPQIVAEIKKLIRSVEPEKFFRLSVEDQLLQIKFKYEELESEDIAEATLSRWREVL